MSYYENNLRDAQKKTTNDERVVGIIGKSVGPIIGSSEGPETITTAV